VTSPTDRDPSHPDDAASGGDDLPASSIGRRERRKLRARARRGDDLWFGLGMFGLVGWSVALPMLVGLAAGIAIDANRPSGHSWTLMLLLIGVIIGCVNAWYWVSRQRRAIERGREDPAEMRQ